MVVLLDITPGHAAETITLPAPRLASGHALEAILHARRSVREFGTTPLTLAEVGQLLWAAQGLTHDGRRTAPSAGALYPLVLYLVAGRVSGLDAGVYRYLPASHQLTLVLAGEVRAALAQAALGQGCVDQAAATLAFAAVPRRTTRQYGERGLRYVHIEVGHAAQNVFLQATALTLATVTVGAFDDAAVARVLKLPREETPLYLMPVGRS
jgi:SagB-type dehydrogenase family enzyme